MQYQLKHRPPLPAAEPPRELSPEGGFEVEDLRVFLLELAHRPARLRLNHELYQKEISRFSPLLCPLPQWLSDLFHLSDAERLRRALSWARALKLAQTAHADGSELLSLADEGRGW